MVATYIEYLRGVVGYDGLVWLAGCHVCGAVEGPFVDHDPAAAWAEAHRCQPGARR